MKQHVLVCSYSEQSLLMETFHNWRQSEQLRLISCAKREVAVFWQARHQGGGDAPEVRFAR